MNGNRYMGGRGIMERTDQLNDRMWFWLPFAFLGALAVVAAWTGAFPRGIDFLAYVAGGFCVLKWVLAGVAIERHTQAMKRETRKYGGGWADS